MVSTTAPRKARGQWLLLATTFDGKAVRQLCLEKKVLPEDQLTAALDPADMTKPGGEGAAGG